MEWTASAKFPKADGISIPSLIQHQGLQEKSIAALRECLREWTSLIPNFLTFHLAKRLPWIRFTAFFSRKSGRRWRMPAIEPARFQARRSECLSAAESVIISEKASACPRATW